MVLVAICKPAANDTETRTEVLIMPCWFYFYQKTSVAVVQNGRVRINAAFSARYYSSANELNDLKGQRSLRTKKKSPRLFKARPLIGHFTETASLIGFVMSHKGKDKRKCVVYRNEYKQRGDFNMRHIRKH